MKKGLKKLLLYFLLFIFLTEQKLLANNKINKIKYLFAKTIALMGHVMPMVIFHLLYFHYFFTFLPNMLK